MSIFGVIFVYINIFGLNVFRFSLILVKEGNMIKGFIYGIVLTAFLFVCSINSYAVTIYEGDIDGFGFGEAAAYNGAYGGTADINGNGILDSGDVLPDLNGNGVLATGAGDDFDNRSAAEAADSTYGAKWTDVSLSTSFAGRPGLPNDAYFYFLILPYLLSVTLITG